MLFQAKIKTNNKEEDPRDLVWVLQGLICKLENGLTSGKLNDDADNEIGEWSVDIEETFDF